jgi:hypothetical protein
MTQRGWVARAWSDAGSGVRTASLVMWTLGLITTAAGVVGDVREWWGDLPFLTNLLSSLAGTLMGIPLALLVVHRITSNETRRQEKHESIRLARVATAEMIRTVRMLSRDDRELARLDQRLWRLTEELLPAVRQRRAADPHDTLALWSEAQAAWPHVLVDGGTANGILRDADSQWRYLRDFVGPRLRAVEVAWPSPSVADAVTNNLSVVSVRYRYQTEFDDELAAAAQDALRDGSMTPLTTLFGSDRDAVLTGIEQRVEDMLVCVRAVTDLLGAVDRLRVGLGDDTGSA